MADIATPTSPRHRLDEAVPVRAAPPAMRQPSKEDMELAEHLLGHSQGLQDSAARDRAVQNGSGHVSPQPTSHEARTAELASNVGPTYEQTTPRADVPEGGQNNEAYGSQSTMAPEAAPAGQVCRYGKIYAFL